MTLLKLLVTLGCWLAASAACQAQGAPRWMQIRVLAEPSGPASMPITLDSRAQQNRARSLLSAGTGLVLSSALTFSYGLARRNECRSEPGAGAKRSLIAAGVTGGIGLAGMLGGAIWLGRASRNGRQVRRNERLAAAGTGALAFLFSQAVLGGLFFADQVCSG